MFCLLKGSSRYVSESPNPTPPLVQSLQRSSVDAPSLEWRARLISARIPSPSAVLIGDGHAGYLDNRAAGPDLRAGDVISPDLVALVQVELGEVAPCRSEQFALSRAVMQSWRVSRDTIAGTASMLDFGGIERMNTTPRSPYDLVRTIYHRRQRIRLAR
ncbi:hypothetical protein BD626DRAFT_176811 [Schizophyllum amplum]|uniref:Uncharacterized protein n=1 Tax=Schizophyllum amplum TaxID=97359 RepID=A0A550C251_9AGAR|nr:hypothetical protein BD626DRAFT_176811 [Auriculariopsis ampla]